jgi:hypothetical protein
MRIVPATVIALLLCTGSLFLEARASSASARAQPSSPLTATAARPAPGEASARSEQEPGSPLAGEVQTFLSGMPATRPGDGLRAEAPGSKAQADAEIALGYHVNDTLTASAVLPLTWMPAYAGHPTVTDPFAKLYWDEWARAGAFTQNSDLRVGGPVTRDSRDAGLTLFVASEQESVYDVPATRATLRLNAFLDTRFYHAGPPRLTSFLYLSPRVEYRVREGVSPYFKYELLAWLKRPAPAGEDGSAEDYDPRRFYQAGLSWDITPRINFSPYLSHPADAAWRAEALTLGGFLNWTFL